MELVCHLRAGRSRQGPQQVETIQSVESFTPDMALESLRARSDSYKRKYDKLLDQTKRQAKHEAPA